MSVLDRHKSEGERIKKINKWPYRLKLLRKRKDDPLTEEGFCERYEIPKSGFNRMKNFVVMATEENVSLIEAAFETEGV